MIFALEGPDKSGKTTAFERLRTLLPDFVFVPPMPVHPSLMPVLSYVEKRQEALWMALYDKDKVYVCDRFVATSGWVYDRLFGRETLVDPVIWQKHLHVLYVEVPLEELQHRYKLEGDPYMELHHYLQLRTLYIQMLERVEHTVLDGRLPPDELAEEVRRAVRRRLR